MEDDAPYIEPGRGRLVYNKARRVIESQPRDERAERIESEAGCSAVSRRFSPDMELRWMPTVDGKIIAFGALPFSGFDTRSEAVAAARKHKDAHHPHPTD